MDLMKEKENVIKELRCLAITCKNGIFVQQLWNEYRQTTGQCIPFRKFGFDNVESFLRSTNQFIFGSTNDKGTVVMAKPTGESAHIMKLVQGQANAKNMKRAPPASLAHRLRSSLRSINNSNNQNRAPFTNRTTNNGNNFTSVKSMIESKPQQTKPLIEQRNKTNPFLTNIATATTTVESANPLNPFFSDGKHKISIKTNNGNQKADQIPWAIQQSKRLDAVIEAQTRLVARPTAKAAPIQSKSTECQVQKSSINQRLKDAFPISSDQPDNCAAYEHKLPTRISAQESNKLPRIERSAVNNLVDHMTKMSLESKSSVQSRLQVPKRRHIEIHELEAKHSSPIVIISEYCQRNEMSDPIYNFVERKKKFTCSVVVDDQRYICYPMEYATKEEAQEATAQIALNEIKEKEEFKKYPVCNETFSEIAKLLFECLPENGVFMDALQSHFQNAYKRSLPKNWNEIIQINADLFELEFCAGKSIVYPKHQKPQLKAAPRPPKLKTIDQINGLQLPWKEYYWRVYVSVIRSTDNIQCYLIGDEYSGKLQKTIESYTQKLQTHEKTLVIASNIRNGGYYLTKCDVDGKIQLMRIQVLHIDESCQQAMCLLIDFGDEETIDLNHIYHMDQTLLDIPAQAIRFSLADLENLKTNPKMEHSIINNIFGKICHIHVQTTCDEYMNRGDNVLAAHFFDDQKQNLNLKILKEGTNLMTPVQLDENCLNNVKIIHINEIGLIYVRPIDEQAMNNAMNIIDRIIKRLTKQTINSIYLADTLTDDELYLIYDENDGKWYRAELMDIDTKSFKYIDHGMIRTVSKMSNIYSLKKLNEILDAIPAQSTRVRLTVGDSKKPEFVQCLQDLLKTDDLVSMDIIRNESVYKVKIWKRINGKLFDIGKLCERNVKQRSDEQSDTSSMCSETNKHQFFSSLKPNQHNRT